MVHAVCFEPRVYRCEDVDVHFSTTRNPMVCGMVYPVPILKMGKEIGNAEHVAVGSGGVYRVQ